MTENTPLRVTLSWRTRSTFDAEVRGHRLTTDAPGEYGDDRGPTPMELVLIALAGCTAMDVAAILAKQRQSPDRFTVRAEGDRATEHPRRFTAIRLIYELEGEALQRAAVERAVQLSLERYCSVMGTLSEAPTVATTVVLQPIPTGTAG